MNLASRGSETGVQHSPEPFDHSGWGRLGLEQGSLQDGKVECCIF